MLLCMNQFPLFISLTHRPILIVGGGSVATRKVRAVLDSGASIVVVSPNVCDAMSKLIQTQQISHEERAYQSGEAAKFWLTIAATDNGAVNAEVARDAITADALVNVTDEPTLGNVSFASIVDRSPLKIAISTGGHSPILARLIRARISTFIPKSYSALTQLAGEYRERVKHTFHSIGQRRRFWENVLTGPVAQQMLKGNEHDARAMLLKQLESHAHKTAGSVADVDLSQTVDEAAGEVYLVGAGPGDPDLLTFRALRLIHQADVVLHDRLVSEDILALCPPEATYIYVGKRRSNHAMPQQTINETLVEHAKAGKRVLRLKGGDPFIFGRGGEELETLADAGVRFEVVPGITAASGCSSYAGIPLTHRDHAQSCVFVTGHLKAGALVLNWDHLVQPNQTVVCYMGLTALNELCTNLISHGLAADTPAALIERGTTQHQRVLTGTLNSLPEIVANTAVKAPTLIIIGSVVTLREQLQWFTPTHAEANASDSTQFTAN